MKKKLHVALAIGARVLICIFRFILTPFWMTCANVRTTCGRRGSWRLQPWWEYRCTSDADATLTVNFAKSFRANLVSWSYSLAESTAEYCNRNDSADACQAPIKRWLDVMTIEDAFYVRWSIQFTAQDAGASRLIHFVPRQCVSVCVMWTNANWRQSDSIKRRMHFLSFLGIFKILHHLIRASLCLGVIEVLQLQVKVINNSLPNFALPRNALFPGLTLFPRCLVHRVCSFDSRWTRTSKTEKKKWNERDGT